MKSFVLLVLALFLISFESGAQETTSSPEQAAQETQSEADRAPSAADQTTVRPSKPLPTTPAKEKNRARKMCSKRIEAFFDLVESDPNLKKHSNSQAKYKHGSGKYLVKKTDLKSSAEDSSAEDDLEILDLTRAKKILVKSNGSCEVKTVGKPNSGLDKVIERARAAAKLNALKSSEFSQEMKDAYKELTEACIKTQDDDLSNINFLAGPDRYSRPTATGGKTANQ